MTPSSLEAPLPAAPPSTQEVAAAAVAPRPIANDACPLAIRGVTKRWRKDQPPVLDGLNLALEPGTIVWVGGRNGAGKTTMLRIAAGLIEPEAGRAEVWGVSARENRVRYQTLVSFLPAGDRGLYARLTVRRQLEFWARISMMAPGGVRHSVEQAMDAFNLRELADQRVDRMSMGQRQRLRIAMTFLASPEVVLLDEPLTSLDAEGAAVLLHAIEQVLGRDGAVVWCSPSGEHLDVSFDASWVIDRGRLVAP
jgi:ABC-2 type transport system ATP-binding protein